MTRPLTESLELIALCNLWLIVCERAWDHNFVDHNPVIVDFCQAICLFQIVETDFIIKWYVVTFASSCNSNDYIFDARVTMNEADVVVEQEHIQNQLQELHQECDEKANETRVLHSSVIVIKFE